MEFDLSLITNSLPLLLQGALVTLEITAMAVGLGLVFGLLAALAQLSKFTPLRLLAKIYVDFIRGTPLLVQIFIIYFALPAIIGQRIDPFVAAVAACSINSGAYVAEIFRAGIQSIEIGQMRAGLSLGMTWGQTMRYIILPQAFKRIIPPPRQRIHRDVEGLFPCVRDRLRRTHPYRSTHHCRNLRFARNLDVCGHHLPRDDAYHHALGFPSGKEVQGKRRPLVRTQLPSLRKMPPARRHFSFPHN